MNVLRVDVATSAGDRGTNEADDLSGGADDRFREMFYEEARELLISLEEGLMDLERRQSDRAHLDKTFRAAHSLKGAAAMVGLGAIAEFTHGIEAVLERDPGAACWRSIPTSSRPCSKRATIWRRWSRPRRPGRRSRRRAS